MDRPNSLDCHWNFVVDIPRSERILEGFGKYPQILLSLFLDPNCHKLRFVNALAFNCAICIPYVDHRGYKGFEHHLVLSAILLSLSGCTFDTDQVGRTCMVCFSCATDGVLQESKTRGRQRTDCNAF